MKKQEYNRESDTLLKSILRADAEARKMTEQASADRDEAFAQLPEEQAAFRLQYESETEQMVKRTEEAAKKASNGKLQAIERERDEKLKKLDELAQSHTAAWVEQIYASILRD